MKHQSLYKRLKELMSPRNEGATMVEYALMVGLIALVCIGAAVGSSNRWYNEE